MKYNISLILIILSLNSFGQEQWLIEIPIKLFGEEIEKVLPELLGQKSATILSESELKKLLDDRNFSSFHLNRQEKLVYYNGNVFETTYPDAVIQKRFSDPESIK